jgi:N-acetylglucosamine kinase-like BadF-type ATPase
VVAADGGNSKTDLVLADITGAILDRRALRGTTPQQDGMPATMQVLADAARSAAAELDLPSRAAVGVFCLANVDLAEDEASARAHLEQLGVAAHVVVRNDTYAVLRAGSPSGTGVAVVCGAGINAVGVAADGRIHRFLGLGPESGDWGGAEAVGMAGLGAAVRAGDGRGPATVLRQEIPAALGRADAERVALDLNRGVFGVRELRRLAPVVLDAATAGDREALAIVDRLAEEVAAFALAALRGLDLLGAPVPVVLGGGVLQSGHALLLAGVRSRLAASAPHAVPSLLDVAPVAGALDEALDWAGADGAARARARASLRV